MDDDNIFDEDDAIDYIIYSEEEGREESPQASHNKGCLSVFLLLLVPLALFRLVY